MKAKVGQINSRIPYTQDDINQLRDRCHTLRRSRTGAPARWSLWLSTVICHDPFGFCETQTGEVNRAVIKTPTPASSKSLKMALISAIPPEMQYRF